MNSTLNIENKGEEIFDLLKIPDSQIIKLLNVKIGELNSCIEEQQSEIKKLKLQLNSPDEELELAKIERSKVKASELYKSQKAVIEKLKSEIKKLRATNNELITKIVKLQGIGQTGNG